MTALCLLFSSGLARAQSKQLTSEHSSQGECSVTEYTDIRLRLEDLIRSKLLLGIGASTGLKFGGGSIVPELLPRFKEWVLVRIGAGFLLLALSVFILTSYRQEGADSVRFVKLVLIEVLPLSLREVDRHFSFSFWRELGIFILTKVVGCKCRYCGK